METIQRERFDGFIEHPGTAAALITNEEGEVLLVEVQRRTEFTSWEIPGGKKDRKESIQESVRREVREETGWEICDLTPLVKISTSPGITDELVHIFSAKPLTHEAVGEHQWQWWTHDAVLELIRAGSIIDCKTLVAALWRRVYG